MSHIKTPSAGEILWEEFMEPMGISAYRLAHDIHVPVSRIQDILHGRRSLSVDTSLRLARYFGMSERFFIDLQLTIDIRQAKETMGEDLKAIQPRAVQPDKTAKSPS